jgi:hypothetical protein
MSITSHLQVVAALDAFDKAQENLRQQKKTVPYMSDAKRRQELERAKGWTHERARMEQQRINEKRTAALKPYEDAAEQARKAIDLTDLPIGTRVSYLTDRGYAGSRTDEGTIVRITPKSYVVERDTSWSDNSSRINRDAQGVSDRRLKVLSGPTGTALRAQRLEARAALYEARREAERALEEAERTYRATKREREGEEPLFHNPETIATERLKQKYPEEYAALLVEAREMFYQGRPTEEQVEAARQAQAQAEAELQAIRDKIDAFDSDI